MENAVDDGPPGQCDVGQVHLEGNTARPLSFFPVMEDLSVTPHSPDGIGRPVIQLISQVSGRDLHGSLEPLVHVVSLGGVPRPGLVPHSPLQPAVQTRARVT